VNKQTDFSENKSYPVNPLKMAQKPITNWTKTT